MTLKLQNILNFTEEEKENARVRFSMSNGIEDPKNVYFRDKNELNTKWFLHSGKKYNNFKKNTIAIHLLMIEKDLWLLTSIKKIMDLNEPKENECWDHNCYITEEIDKYRPFFNKVFVSYHKNRQSGKYKWNTICDKLLISKIDNEEYGINSFNGYKFELSYNQLSDIMNRKDWCDALRHIQAVYLQTDNKTGKFYVGSATNNEDYLLSRWKEYVKNGHGGNVKLKELIEREGMDYIKKNFTYRILDYFSESYPSAKVIESECYWKDVFKSRKFGYNAN